MKVGTDGVLLGAWVRLRGKEQHILDVGTGTGVIALMLAQRTSLCDVADGLADREHFSASGTQDQSDETQAQAATIIGIDIDKLSAEEAAANFKASPWAGRMAAFAGDFRGLGTDPSHPLKYLAFPYDLIISNPPYFVDALKAPDPRRNDARHADSLTYADLVANAVRNLAPDGQLALILPADASRRKLRPAASTSAAAPKSSPSPAPHPPVPSSNSPAPPRPSKKPPSPSRTPPASPTNIARLPANFT